MASVLVLMLLFAANQPVQALVESVGEVTEPATAMPGEKPQAEPKVTLAEAVATARKVLPIPAEWGEPQGMLEPYMPGLVWILNWDGGRQGGASAMVDALTGRVVQFYDHRCCSTRTQPFRLTRSEAEPEAVRWLKQLVGPELAGQMAPAPDQGQRELHIGEPSHHFQWERTALGHPMPEDGVTIGIDGVTGELSQFSLAWTDGASFALPQQRLPEEEAERLFLANLSLRLAYRHSEGTGEYRLVYRSNALLMPGYLTQAGEMLNYAGRPQRPQQERMRLVEAPEQPFSPPAKPLDQAAALAVAQAIVGRTDDPSEITRSHWAAEEGRNPAWHIAWMGEGESYQHVTVDAVTGLVTAMHHYDAGDYEEAVTWKLSVAEAEEAVATFLRTHRPDLAGGVAILHDPSVEAMVAESGGSLYPVWIVELHRGLPVENLGQIIEVDMVSGQVRGLWFEPKEQRASLPEPELASLSEEQARELFLKAKGVMLGWHSFWRDGERTDPQLVWTLGHGPMAGIDAVTGAALDWQGRELVDSQSPTDIAGHTAAREIELLWARGIADTRGGRFEPDLQISTGDALRWLTQATTGHIYERRQGEPPGSSPLEQFIAANPSASYLRAALEAGIIRPEEFPGQVELGAPVSRERFALWAVRALGHERIAAMAVRIPMAFTDAAEVSGPYANAVAILAGLGLVQADADGKFNPKGNLTRGDAARIIYRLAEEAGAE